MKNRLDSELVRRGLARSRENAADLIESRSVLVNGRPATKSATQVDAETSITLQGDRDDFVSRGGLKLAGALDAFSGVVVAGKKCLDAGASTGGFTDVLLRRDAALGLADLRRGHVHERPRRPHDVVDAQAGRFGDAVVAAVGRVASHRKHSLFVG